MRENHRMVPCCIQYHRISEQPYLFPPKVVELGGFSEHRKRTLELNRHQQRSHSTSFYERHPRVADLQIQAQWASVSNA